MIGNVLRRGGKTLIDKTQLPLTEIVQQPYTTSASARPQRLSNGWLVSGFINTAPTYDTVVLKVSKDNGLTWIDLCYVDSNPHNSTGLSLASINNVVHLLVLRGSDNVTLYNINVESQSNVNIYANRVNIDSSQTAFSGCSIAVNPTNGHLTAAWSSKNATYPNSFNIRSAKSVNGGVTWTKQNGTAGVDQITSMNESGTNRTEPCVIYNNNNSPIIFNCYRSVSSGWMSGFRYNGSWDTSGSTNIYSAGNYTQSSPSATVQRYGSNVGRIWVAWDGMDSTDTSANNIRVAYSDDSGVTWSSMTKLTTGNTNYQVVASITSNNKGEVFAVWQGWTATNTYNIRYIKWNGSWGAITNITNQSVSNIRYPSTCDNYYDFDQPITIWQDNQDVGDKVLLHMNGINGSTTFTDSSGKVWTANGNAQISTAQGKFGGASAYFDGSGDWIDTPDSADFTVGSDNFTIDFWVKRGSLSGSPQDIFGKCDTDGQNTSFLCGFNYENKIVTYIGNLVNYTSTATLTDTSSWHHIAIVRNGTVFKTYLDGVEISSSTSSGAVVDSNGRFAIGRNGQNPNILSFNGYIDEFRFTKGIARWTSNFTPPTSESVYSNNPPSVDFYGKFYV